jgi:SAM-dependent methyltransferase
METTDRQSLHFESIAKRYFSARHTANHLLYKRLLWRSALRGVQIKDRNQIDVLEPMCGYAEGKSIVELFFKGKILYDGFDTSATLLEKAREKKPGLNLFQADVIKFVPQKKYDVVILTGGLHHVFQSAASVLRIMRGAIKDSGMFINFEPTHACSLTRAVREKIYKGNSLFDSATERGFELDELNGLYRQAGFHVADQLYPGLLAYVLFYNPDAFPFLNIGGRLLVKSLFGMDRLFYKTRIGRFLSFATLSILKPRLDARRPQGNE